MRYTRWYLHDSKTLSPITTTQTRIYKHRESYKNSLQAKRTNITRHIGHIHKLHLCLLVFVVPRKLEPLRSK